MKLHQNQVVFYGCTRGIITNVGDKTVNVHLIDGRYRLNMSIEAILLHPFWSVTNEKASFEEANKFIDESQTLKHNYVVKCRTLNGAVYLRYCFSDNAVALSAELNEQRLSIIEFLRSKDQILKPVVKKNGLL
ncbi:hypothetical protein [Pseudoalteromonas sp. SR41-6]|uniref:hypothetical protein n=1 Tax=Pseudoalteromonas sp. SR41-6 TaxID=2760948 RepID=UPI0016021C53|nr:hypothetical protein [Pseudoalteromonas sp. SR41-6]MBB1333977.1 hypothetical protein [Pseudoalteromonas sp. SR41-6]